MQKPLKSDFDLDFTTNEFSYKNLSFVKKILSNSKKNKNNVLKILDFIYPVSNSPAIKNKIFHISSHVSLSGENPLVGNPCFVPLTNVYLFNDGITVAGLMHGVKPNSHEAVVLLKNNINFYSYSVVPTVIYAASLGFEVYAFGKCV